MTVMSRQPLFEAAWQRPLTEIAAELGVTDVGLRKICDRHDIPTPGRGYWAQVRAKHDGPTFSRRGKLAHILFDDRGNAMLLVHNRRRGKFY